MPCITEGLTSWHSFSTVAWQRIIRKTKIANNHTIQRIPFLDLMDKIRPASQRGILWKVKLHGHVQSWIFRWQPRQGIHQPEARQGAREAWRQPNSQ